MIAQNPMTANFGPQMNPFANGMGQGFGQSPMGSGMAMMGAMGQQQQAMSAMMGQMMSMMSMVLDMMVMKQMQAMMSGNPGFGGGGAASSGPGTNSFLGGGSSPAASVGGGGGGGGATATAPTASTGGSTAIGSGGKGEASVKWALSQEGISEAKNMDVVRSYSQGRNEAWCAHFVSTALEKSGGSPFGHQASVAGILDWGKKNEGHFISAGDAKASPNKLKVGDVVVWKQGGASHVGLLTGVNSDGTFSTIEGNTSDKVAKRTHKFADGTLTGFVRPEGSF